MKSYKKQFINFLTHAKALKFGDFVTKSGRNTPFFVNFGSFNSGEHLDKLGQYYAEAIVDKFGSNFDVLFGPAYKGIPIAVATAMALSQKFGINCKYTSNRKEIKDHGDTGLFLGHKLQQGDRVIIVEDVTTAGTSVHETMEMVKDLGVQVVGLVVSVDRMERGKTEKSALQELQDTYGFVSSSIVTMQEVKEYLSTPQEGSQVLLTAEQVQAINDYYKKYGKIES